MRRESLHGSEPIDPHVESVLVVVSQEVGQGARSSDGRRVGADVGPFAETGANEAFGLADVGPVCRQFCARVRRLLRSVAPDVDRELHRGHDLP